MHNRILFFPKSLISKFSFGAVFALICLIYPAVPARAQVDSALYSGLKWRNIGPFRGGRSLAVVGHPDLPRTFFFGATGGGVWKTEDGGATWKNVSDSTFNTASVGALAIAPSDPNIIFAGTGERDIRGNISPGDGIYKSMDGGKTWKHSGLEATQTISRIVIDPRDANRIYVAALGHVFGKNPERGVFRSLDGGKTWQKILYRNDHTGAVDLALDPFNPRVLYAALWDAHRTPYSMSSGGPGSGLFKSVDGGDTWKELSKQPGMPRGIKGKIGVAVSPAQKDRVWAIIEAKEGGVFRSDDAGKTWRRVNKERQLRQRAFYYTHIYADPKNPDGVYVLNVRFHKSLDGGKTFKTISVPHGDNHDLWIDPNDPLRMIEANDGSANVSYDGGKSWSAQDIPTAQFYHVLVDNQFPYRIYGAQQDNSTISIPSRTTSYGIDRQHWYSVGGGESGYIAVRPDNPDIVFAGSYDGYLTRYDHKTGQTRNIAVWPENPMGAGAGKLKYRFQWTFPIIISPHDPNTLYVGGNHVFKSTDEGESWEVISGDLTRNDPSKMGPSGGPITKDNTSVEYYCTIFTLAESPLKKGLLWAGSDDGLIHVSRDGGKKWENVTPKKLPEWALISIIEPSHFDPGTAYVAANRYKSDDFQPYLFKTTDYGKSWKRINSGIPANEYTRVIREDPTRRGLLYAGTERGIYVSFDDGKNWQSLQLNLPHTPIRDIAVQPREHDLVVATHGRAFWVLDDVTPLYQITAQSAARKAILYRPRTTYRMGGFSFFRPGMTFGPNPPSGVMFRYYFRRKPAGEVKLEILDGKGKVIRHFSSYGKNEKKPKEGPFFGEKKQPEQLPAKAEMNRFVWNMRYPGAKKLPKSIMWAARLSGPRALPGKYRARLIAEGDTLTQPFVIKEDPRLTVSPADLQAQFDLLIKIRDRVTDAHKAVIKIREIRKQVNAMLQKTRGDSILKPLADSLLKKLGRVENAIVQTKIKSGQDALNFPIKLNNKIAALAGTVASADARPTKQEYDVFADLSGRLQMQLDRLDDAIKKYLPALNEAFRKADVPAIRIKEEK